MKKRVILDTDPGVDDALAIILAILSPQLKVEAITTVNGNVNVDLCTRNVLRILEILEPDMPPLIARGESQSISDSQGIPDASDVHGKDGLGDLDRLKKYPEPSLYPVSSRHAVDLILSLLAENPGEITLIALGPLTNIARAILHDPDGMKKVKEIIIMGGAFRVPGNVTAVAEFNIFADPQAAHIVVNSGLPITFVGLDVTHKVCLSESHIQQYIKPLNTRLSQFILDMISIYMDFHKRVDGVDGIYMHDPMAVGVAIDPGLVEAEELNVQVETEGKITRGMTVADLRPSTRRLNSRGNVHVCYNVDSERFLRLFLDTIKSIY